jgi:hypothetical protein
MHLDHPSKRLGWADEEAAVDGFEVTTVIGDETREAEQPLVGGFD